MFLALLKKKLLQQIQTQKFMILAILSIVLMILCIHVAGEQYLKKLESYNRATSLQRLNLEKVQAMTEETRSSVSREAWDSAVFRKPTPLCIFCMGNENRFGVAGRLDPIRTPFMAQSMSKTDTFNEFDLKEVLGGILEKIDFTMVIWLLFSLLALFLAFDLVSGEREQGTLKLWQKIGEKGNLYLPSYHMLDWTFIVQILFSLLLILLSYNAISEERETKTLVLIGSNAVSRWQIYIGKFVSLFSLSSVTLLVSMLAGLTTILLVGEIPVGTALMARLALFFMLSLVYGALFLLIGMGCSVLFRRSTISLLVSMTVWLFLVIIIPDSFDILINRSQNNPSDYELYQQYTQLENGALSEIGKLRNEIESRSNYTETEKQNIIEQTRSTIIRIENEEVGKTSQLAEYILQLNIRRYQERQIWKKLSPTILYRDNAERLLYSGNFYFLDFLDQVRNFTLQFQENMLQKHGTLVDYYHYVRAKINDEYVVIQPETPKYEYNHMELQVRKPGILDSFQAALAGMAVLLTVALGVGLWGFIGFIRCDIR
ncbi:MAG: ABC transporter permease [Candidatus Latescibacteria bacterium]|nr:ABC transporter permease [Candidatus Latescibacterota bacterium]